MLDLLLADFPSSEVGGNWFRRKKILSRKDDKNPLPQTLIPLIHKISKILNLSSKDIIHKQQELSGFSYLSKKKI